MYKTNKKAFTIIELVVAMTIFAVFISVTLSSYVYLTRNLRDAKAAKDLNSQSMNAMNTMIDEVKVYQIDYECYSGSSHAVCSEVQAESSNEAANGIIESSYLVLRSTDGMQRTLFRLSDSKLEFLKQVIVNDEWTADSGFENVDQEPYGFKNILGTNVSVKSGKFYITPNKNPFSNENASDAAIQYQPQVTFDIDFMATSQIRGEIYLPVLTTVSTRFYGR